jgi:UDPglucose 6-dehydrogenase
MGWQGTRLLHDHIICKPHKGHNDKIPWHQDSMFWPVDSPGVSSWTPFLDVGLDDGCLQVIDMSHLGGCDSPVDFMAKEKDEFPEDAVQVFLPVSKGDTILIHSLTWHRSSPNTGSHDRPVHIGLWVHADSKWRPDLVDWHPVNEHVETEPLARMEGAMFPFFGKIEPLSSPDEDIHTGTIRHNAISMYDASKIVANQMRLITGVEENLPVILGDKNNIEVIVQETIKLEFSTSEQIVTEALERLRISFLAYEKHRARNVYNSAYSNWWEVAGSQWHNYFNPNLGVIGLGSVGSAARETLCDHFNVIGFDIDGRGNWNDILSTDAVFVCVPTNGTQEGQLDMSNIFNVVSSLDEAEFKGLVVIKSTLQPGTMDCIQIEYPSLRVSYVPEFLREKDALEWFQNPDRITYSCRPEDEELLLKCFNWVQSNVPRIPMSNIDAELGKLAHNAFIATKVTFTCEIERISKHFGANPELVMETVWRDRRINNPSHLTPNLGGYGGKCVPKDTASLASIDPDPESLLHHLKQRGSAESHKSRME